MNAREVIGEQDPHDRSLRPEAHRTSLPPEAGALTRILQSERVKAIVARYRMASTAAAWAQAEYKNRGRRLAWYTVGPRGRGVRTRLGRGLRGPRVAHRRRIRPPGVEAVLLAFAVVPRFLSGEGRIAERPRTGGVMGDSAL